MNAGQAITGACRDQRAKDMARLREAYHHRYHYHVMAYWWWGWDIAPGGRGGIGKPGSDL